MSTSASRPSDQQIQFPDRFEMNSSKEKFAFLILISVLVFNGGCGQEEASGPEPSTYSVRGTILQADGKPLSMGMVEFQPLGDTKANGQNPRGERLRENNAPPSSAITSRTISRPLVGFKPVTTSSIWSFAKGEPAGHRHSEP